MMPPAPAPQPAHPAPLGALQFTTQGSVMTSSIIRPTVLVNGHPVLVPHFGTAMIPVPPGPVTVEAHMTYLWGPYGRAGLRCVVQPGQTVPVFYAPPLTAWVDGRMGVEPQPRPGLAAFLTLLGVTAGITLAAIALMVFVAVTTLG